MTSDEADELFRLEVALRFYWTPAEVDAIPLHVLRYQFTRL